MDGGVFFSFQNLGPITGRNIKNFAFWFLLIKC